VCAAKFLEQLQVAVQDLTIEFSLVRVNRPYPGAFDFIILRLFSLTLFKSRYLGNKVKQLLAWYLIQRKPKILGTVIKRYNLGEDFTVNESVIGLSNAEVLQNTRHFSAIHMASQGYWQKGDDEMLDGGL
jgi:hypothetical protein